jgi:predicted TIM-barrel fold metal-dependent hydrolase
MILLFHTGIVNRTDPDTPSDVSSDRMRAGTLDLVARRFPKLRIVGAHLGNPDYAWAAGRGDAAQSAKRGQHPQPQMKLDALSVPARQKRGRIRK